MATKINRVLITGSRGFIGSHLFGALVKRGYEVFGYDLKNIALGSHDILDTKVLRDAFIFYKPDIIIHLAAISNRQDTNKDPELALKTNIIGTFNVLTFAKKYRAKVIVASSAATYEPELSIYGTSKDCMEKIAGLFDNVQIVRFYNVYGPGSKSVVNKFIERVQKGKLVTLNGNTTRDYIYVTDIVGGLIEIISNNMNGKIYELGTGVSTSLQELIKMIGNILNKNYKSVLGNPIKEIQESKMDSKYSFFKTLSLEEGIRRLI